VNPQGKPYALGVVGLDTRESLFLVGTPFEISAQIGLVVAAYFIGFGVPFLSHERMI